MVDTICSYSLNYGDLAFCAPDCESVVVAGVTVTSHRPQAPPLSCRLATVFPAEPSNDIALKEITLSTTTSFFSKIPNHK